MVDILNTSDILATELKCNSMSSKTLSTEPNALGLNLSLSSEPDFSHMARSFLSADGLGARSVKSSVYARAPTKYSPSSNPHWNVTTP